MTRNEKRLAALIVGANLVLGFTLARKAELGQLFQSEDGLAGEAVETSTSPGIALAPEEGRPDVHPTPTPKD